MNYRGVAVLLNILGHRDDGPPVGVPIHVLCRSVLDQADGAVAALEMVATADVSSSSAVTIVTDEEGGTACSVEVSPAGPGFVNGLKTQGIGLFLWGVVATTVPLVLGMFVAKYVFRFHDALNLGIVSGARTTTASLGLVCDQAKSQIPALGYTVTYAVGNTLLTIWGMVIIMLLS